MELISVVRSASVRFMEAETPVDLFFTDLIHGIQQRYRFFDVPTKTSEVDVSAGVSFQLGKLGDTVINKLTIYQQGVSAEGAVATPALDDFIDDLLSFTVSEFGVTHRDHNPVSRTYVSSLEVRPSRSFSSYIDKLSPLRKALSEMLQAEGFSIPLYDFNGISLHVDQDQEQTKPLRPGKFIFERRAGRVFNENIYYSEAPATTENHLRLLELLEASL